MAGDPDQLQIALESFPAELRPMQAASAEAPFSSPDYLFEVKWDGLRCLVFRDSDGRARLQDRGLHDLTAGAALAVRQAGDGDVGRAGSCWNRWQVAPSRGTPDPAEVRVHGCQYLS